ncbi:hypothetical protein JYK22_12205, partial [Nonomuraea sp. RK-328]|nr:hypothetical protein [Nonomuraea sp. RK-328]
MSAFPEASQHQLLMEYGFGFWFSGQWVSIGDSDEVARRLQVAAETIVTCDLQTAMRSFSPGSATRCVWITSLSPGWSHILILSGRPPSLEMLSLGDHRVFELTYLGEVGEIEPPFYAHDGEVNVDFFSMDEYRPYWDDLAYDPLMPPAEELEQYLLIMGRISGRFLDRDWVSSQGLLCRVP